MRREFKKELKKGKVLDMDIKLIKISGNNENKNSN